jgi:DnaK suppressor protein
MKAKSQKSQWAKRMRGVLVRRREALRRSLEGELGLFRTSHERVVGDAVDDALDTDYGLVNSQLAEAESRELSAIENALERIEDGDYGTCERCGERIPQARLQALPYATTCVSCQRSAEEQRTRDANSRSIPVATDPENSDVWTWESLNFVQ